MQLADANLKVAECDAIIMSQNDRIKELEEELKESRKEQIKEMNADAE